MASLKSVLGSWFPPGTTARWLLNGVYLNPLAFPVAMGRSLWATRKLTGSFFPISVRMGVGQKLKVHRHPHADVTLKGILRVSPWGGSHLTSSISIGEGAAFKLLGDFEIGPGVHISISNNAKLRLGGRKSSSASGITCNSRIMTEKSIEIGADCIIAWDVFVSDSDWHDIKGVTRCDPVVIGDNVWIAHGASITKGARVPDGCIVGAKSLVGRGEFPEKSLIAGTPAIVRRQGVEWSR